MFKTYKEAGYIDPQAWRLFTIFRRFPYINWLRINTSHAGIILSKYDDGFGTFSLLQRIDPDDVKLLETVSNLNWLLYLDNDQLHKALNIIKDNKEYIYLLSLCGRNESECPGDISLRDYYHVVGFSEKQKEIISKSPDWMSYAKPTMTLDELEAYLSLEGIVHSNVLFSVAHAGQYILLPEVVATLRELGTDMIQYKDTEISLLEHIPNMFLSAVYQGCKLKCNR